MADLHRDDIVDVPDVADDVQTLMNDIDSTLVDGGRLRGECRPPLDVVETAKAVEVVMDVPGLPASAIRVLMRRNVLMVVGAKAPASGERPSRVHVAERNYGRFARTVRIDAAVDATRATASLRLGQLRIVLPRLDDRRGVSIPISIEAAQ